VRVVWDAAQSPLAVVRDARTGEILSLARGGAAVVESRDPELQIELSNGVRSHLRRRGTVQGERIEGRLAWRLLPRFCLRRARPPRTAARSRTPARSTTLPTS